MSRRKKILQTLLGFIIVISINVAVLAWQFFGNAVDIGSQSVKEIRIPRNMTMEKLPAYLEKHAGLTKNWAFRTAAKLMKYKTVYACKISLRGNESAIDLVRMLRAGRYQTVNLVIREGISLKELAEAIADRMEPSYREIDSLMKDAAFLQQVGTDSKDIYGIFIPNTYNLYYRSSPLEIFSKLKKASDIWWDSTKKREAAEQGLNREQASTLASIVQGETLQEDEMPVIAGVYLNRLRKGMKLQADPTVAYARGYGGRIDDPLKYPSPYNTYIHEGLPPGPINIPGKAAIESVLNASVHSYIYFCAKPDGSGYHDFAVTYEQHLVNAAIFRKKTWGKK